MKSLFSKVFFISGTILLLNIAVIQMKNIKPFQVEDLLAKDHPIRLSYEKYKKKYTDENNIFILVHRDQEFFDSEITSFSEEIEKRLKPNKHITSINGVYNLKYFDYIEDSFRVRSFFENNQLTSLGKKALDQKMWQNILVDKDKNNFLLTLQISPLLTKKQEYSFVKDLQYHLKSVEKKLPDTEIHMLGTRVANFFFYIEMFRNQTVITPLLFILIGFFFFLLFRSFQVVTWVYFTIIVAYSVTISTIIGFEGGLGPYSGFALMFIFIIATSDLIHYFSSLSQHKHPKLIERLKAVDNEIFKPCLFTSLTTCIGFLSLCLNENLPVRYFGLYCCFGTLLCFFLTFYVLPLGLKIFNYSNKESTRIFNLNSNKIWHFILKKGTLINWSTLLFAGLLIFGTTQLKIDDNFFEKFLVNHPLSQSISTFSEEMNFVGSIDLLVRPKEKNPFSKKELKTLTNLENHIEAYPEVAFTKTALQIYKEVERVVKEDVTEGYSEVSQSIFKMLQSFGAFLELYEEFSNELKFSIFLNTLDSNTLEKVIAKLSSIPANYLEFRHIEIVPAGFSVIRNYINNNVIRNFVSSFLTSFLLIFLVFLLFFRSFKWAAICMLPNLLPVLFVSGTMGLLGIKMESNLVILACVTLGIGVDDTIHFIYNLRRQLKEKVDFETAVKNTIDKTSKALTGTTLAIIFSFPVFFLSDLKLFTQVGFFLLMSLVVALIADFVLLPSLLLKTIKNKQT